MLALTFLREGSDGKTHIALDGLEAGSLSVALGDAIFEALIDLEILWNALKMIGEHGGIPPDVKEAVEIALNGTKKVPFTGVTAF